MITSRPSDVCLSRSGVWRWVPAETRLRPSAQRRLMALALLAEIMHLPFRLSFNRKTSWGRLVIQPALRVADKHAQMHVCLTEYRKRLHDHDYERLDYSL